MYFIGAHINREKTLLDTFESIKSNGGNSLQIFVSNPRSTALVNIEKYIEISSQVQKYCKDNNFKIVIHSPYTINMAKDTKNGKKIIDLKDCYWVQLLLHELHISHLLGSVGVVVHVGKHTTLSYDEGLQNMFQVIKYITMEMKLRQYNTKLIIETPAGQGTELLKDLGQFVNFYNSFTKEQKEYLGICVDTAHVWSAGYELEDAIEILSKNQKDIVVIHFNNSKVAKGAMADRHETILNGVIPKDSMKNFINMIEKLIKNPLIILETPSKEYDKELLWVRKVIENGAK